MPFDALPHETPTADDLSSKLLTMVRDCIAAPNGWCQHSMHGAGQKRCIVGWISSLMRPDARADERRFDAAVHVAGLAIYRIHYCMPRSTQMWRSPIQAVMRYNDNRTKRSVLRLLDKAIAAE